MNEPERYISNAQWPLDVYKYNNGVSTDTHKTREQAQAVCDGIKKHGFGGEGKSFPLRVWVSFDG